MSESKLDRLWLIGTFITNKKKARLEALYELTWGAAVGTLPFWLGGFVSLAIQRDVALKLEGSLFYRWWMLSQTTWDKGELLIFAVSCVAPALWLSMHEPATAKPLPHRRPIIAITAIVGILSAVLYALIQAGVTVNPNFVYASSVSAALLAMGVMYLALTYHLLRLPEVPPVNEEMFVADQEDFIKQVQEQKERENGNS